MTQPRVGNSIDDGEFIDMPLVEGNQPGPSGLWEVVHPHPAFVR